MRLFQKEEIKSIEARAMKAGLTEDLLMENAGHSLAKACKDILQTLNQKAIVVLVGKGNNGGDGLVAARFLAQEGSKVTVLLAEGRAKLKGSTLRNYELLAHSSVLVKTWPKALKGQTELVKLCLEADLILDGLLGTGFHGQLKGSYREIISSLPEELPVLAIDIPSGVEADTGKADVAIKAQNTVTMLGAKTGLYLYPGAFYSGRVRVASLGVPDGLLKAGDGKYHLVTEDIAAEFLPKRRVTAHKGNNGRIAVWAGAKGYVGAAELTSRAVVRAGGGLVHLMAPEEVVAILATKLTEVMVDQRALSCAEALVATLTSDALAVGPGLGRDAATAQLLQEFLPQVGMPVVLDADGLSAFVKKPMLLKAIRHKILTPHPKELASLMGVTTKEVVEHPVTMATAAAKRFQAVVLLKVVPALVATAKGDVYVNTSGNEGMATGGTGDVLTGIIAAFLGQGLELTQATLGAMYVHGRAGDKVGEKGKIGMRASDLVEALPMAIQEVGVQE